MSADNGYSFLVYVQLVLKIISHFFYSYPHAGLETYIGPLDESWNKRRVKEYMSRADFWALCANEAVLKSFTDAQVESGM